MHSARSTPWTVPMSPAMRFRLLCVSLFALVISGTGCYVVPCHPGMVPWAGSPYEACVDCDPFYGPPPVAAYDKRTRRELRNWYRQLNARGKFGRHPGGYPQGFGCDCGACFDVCCDDWCCDDVCGFDSCVDGCFPCDATCGAPLIQGFDDGSYADMSVMDYGAGGYGGPVPGEFGTCPTCRQNHFPPQYDSMPQHPGKYVPPPVPPYSPMVPVPDDSYRSAPSERNLHGPAAPGQNAVPEAPMVPGGDVPVPRSIPTPDPVPVPAPIDPSPSAVRPMHYWQGSR